MSEYTISDDFEPISEIHGNIEVSFNSKIKELDQYEPIEEQLDEFIIAIGKTGRSNRLTVKCSETSSEELMMLSETISLIAAKLQELEKLSPENNLDNQIDKETRNRMKKIKEQIPENKGERIDKVIEDSGVEKQKAEEIIHKLKLEGELFVPEDGKVQMI